MGTLWADYSGKKIHYSTIHKKQTVVQPTYLTHTWVITNQLGPFAALKCQGLESGEELACIEFTVEKDMSITVIKHPKKKISKISESKVEQEVKKEDKKIEEIKPKEEV